MSLEDAEKLDSTTKIQSLHEEDIVEQELKREIENEEISSFSDSIQNLKFINVLEQPITCQQIYVSNTDLEDEEEGSITVTVTDNLEDF